MADVTLRSKNDGNGAIVSLQVTVPAGEEPEEGTPFNPKILKQLTVAGVAGAETQTVITGSCYVKKAVAGEWEILSGGFTFNAVALPVELNGLKPLDVTIEAFHVGSDGLQASVGTGRVLRLRTFTDDGVTPSSVWHELTTSAGTEKAEDVVSFCAAHGIELFPDKSLHASAEGVHAAWVRDGDNSAIVFKPPFSLSVVGAVWRPASCWVWTKGDKTQFDFTDLPFTPEIESTWRPWNNPDPKLRTATLNDIAGENPSLTLTNGERLTATGRVTDGVNDLTTAWQYADVKLPVDSLSEFGVWVEWKIPSRSTPSRTAIEAASVDSGLQGLFSFHPASADKWSCELGLRPQSLIDRKKLAFPRIQLTIVESPPAPAPAPTAKLTLTVTDPHLVALSPELRFFGPNLTDPDSIPHAPRLADSLVAARVEFSSDDSVEDGALVADPTNFTITANGNQVRAWLPLPWAGIDDGTLTGANLPASPLGPDRVGAGGPIVRDRNHGLVPVDVSFFTIEPGTETQLPAITLLTAPTQTSQDDRAQREVVAAMLPWVNMQASDNGGTLNVQFTPYHRNMVLEHFEDREASQAWTPTPGVDQPTREPSDARKKRVRDRYSQAAESVAVGTKSPLLNWLPGAPETSVGQLTINRASNSQSLPGIGWWGQNLVLAQVGANGHPLVPSPFLEAEVSWPEESSDKIQINRNATAGNASAGHVPPVFLAPAIVAVDAAVVPAEEFPNRLILAFVDGLGDAYVWSADKAGHEAPIKIGSGFKTLPLSVHVVRTGKEGDGGFFRVVVRSETTLSATTAVDSLADIAELEHHDPLPAPGRFRNALVFLKGETMWRMLAWRGERVQAYKPNSLAPDPDCFEHQTLSIGDVTDVRCCFSHVGANSAQVLMAYAEVVQGGGEIKGRATLSLWKGSVDLRPVPLPNPVVTFTEKPSATFLSVSEKSISVLGLLKTAIETWRSVGDNLSTLSEAERLPLSCPELDKADLSHTPLWADGLDPATAFLVAKSKDEGDWLRWSVPVLGNGTSASPPLAVRAHRGALNAIQIVEGADRPQVITGGADGAVAVWDLQSGQEILRLDPLRRRIDTLAVDRDATGPDFEDTKLFDVRTLNWKATTWRVLSTLAPADGRNVELVNDAEAGHSIAIVASDLLLKEDSGQWKPVPAGSDALPVPVGSVGLFATDESAPKTFFASWPRIGGWPFLPVGVTFTLDAADSSAVKEITITGLLLNPTDAEDLPERGIPEFARQALADSATVGDKTITVVIASNGVNNEGTVTSVKGGFDWTFQLANQIPPTEAPRSIPGRIERIKGTVGWDPSATPPLSLTITKGSLVNALGVSWPLRIEDLANPAKPITLSPESLPSGTSPLLALRESFPNNTPGTLEMRHVLPAMPALPAGSQPRSIPLAVGRGSDGEAVVITGATADDLFVTDIDGGMSRLRCRDRYRDGVLVQNHRATTKSSVPYEAVLVHVDGSLHVVGAMDSVKDGAGKWTFKEPTDASPRRFELESPIEAVVVFDDFYNDNDTDPHRLYLCRCADGSARLLDDNQGEVQRFDVPGTTVTAMSFGPGTSVGVTTAALTYTKLTPPARPLTYVALGGADGSIRCYEIPHDVASATSQQAASLPVWRQWFDLTGAVTSISLVADDDFYWKSRDEGLDNPPDANEGAMALYACSRAGDPPLVREVFRDAQPGLIQTPSVNNAVIVNMRVLTQGKQSVGVWHNAASKQLEGWIKNQVSGSTTVSSLQPPIDDGESFSWSLARDGGDTLVYLTAITRHGNATPSVYPITGTTVTPQTVSDVSIDDCLAVHTAVNKSKCLLSLLLDATGRPSLYCANDPGNLATWTASTSFPFVQSKADGLAATFSETIVDVVTRIVAGRVEVWDVALDRLRWVSPAASGSFRDDDIQLVRFAFIRQRPILVCGRFGAVEFWNLATGQVEHRFATNGIVTHLDVALDDNGNAKILVANTLNGTPAFTIHSLHDNSQQSLIPPAGAVCNWLRFYRYDTQSGVVAVCGASDTGSMAGAIWEDLSDLASTSKFTLTVAASLCDVFVRGGHATVVASDGAAFGGTGRVLAYDYRILAAGSTGVPTDSSAIALRQKNSDFEVGVLNGTFTPGRSITELSVTTELINVKNPAWISIGWQALSDTPGRPSDSSPFGIHVMHPKGWFTNLFATDSSLCGVRTRTLPTSAPSRDDKVNWPVVVSVEQGAKDGVVVRCWDRHSGMLRCRFVVADVGTLLPRGLLSIGSGARPAVWIAGTKKIRSLDWGTGQVVDVLDAGPDVPTGVAMAWSPGPAGDPNRSGVAIALEQGGAWKAAAVPSTLLPVKNLVPVNLEYSPLPYWLPEREGDGRDFSKLGGWSLAAVASNRLVTGPATSPPSHQCNLVSSVGAASAIVRPFGGDGSVDHICPLVIPAAPTGDSGRLLVVWRDTASGNVHLADGCLTPSGTMPSTLVASRSFWGSATAVSDKCDPLLISDALGVRIVAVDDATGLPVVFSPTPWIRLSSAAAPRADLRFSFGNDKLFEGRITPSSQCELALKAKALPGVAFDLTARPTLVQGDATTFALQAAGVSTSEFCSLEAGVIVISGVRIGRPPVQPPAPAWRAFAIWESIVSSTVTVKTAANSIESETSTLRLLVSAKCSNTPSLATSSFEIVSTTVTGIVRAKKPAATEWQMHIAEQPASELSKPTMSWAFATFRSQPTSFDWQGFLPISLGVDLKMGTIEVTILSTPLRALPLVADKQRPRRGIPTVRDDVVLPQPPDNSVVVALSDQVVDLSDALPVMSATPTWYSVVVAGDSLALKVVTGDVPLDPLGGVDAIVAMPKEGIDTIQLAHRRDLGGRLRAGGKWTNIDVSAYLVLPTGTVSGLLLLPAVAVDVGTDGAKQAQLMYETLVVSGLPLPTRDRGLRSEMQTESVVWVTPPGDSSPEDQPSTLNNMLTATAVAATRGQLPTTIFSDRAIRNHAIEVGANGLLLKRTLDAAGGVTVRFVNSPYHALEPQTLEEGDNA